MPDRKPKKNRVTPHREKLCRRCGRAFTWREDRAQDWDIAKYCSVACLGEIAADTTQALKAAILDLLAERGPAKTVCPSEAAKAVGGRGTRHDWESLMEPARTAARRLAAAGRILVTQHGKVVDPVTAKGPIRLRLPDAR